MWFLQTQYVMDGLVKPSTKPHGWLPVLWRALLGAVSLLAVINAAAQQISHELDAYYSNIGVDVPISSEAEPDGGTLGEVEVYRELLRTALKPRIFLLETSVNPLPWLGALYKSNDPDSYERANQARLLDSVTAGFQEPWALSAFLGSTMRFSREGESVGHSNRAYMGWLLSYGAEHIRNNVLINDHWWELEWKLKGDREFRDEKLSWSFRLGFKEHGNPYIRDVAYVGFRRDSLNFLNRASSWLDNAGVEIKTEIARDDGSFMRQELLFNRNFPLPRWRAAFVLDVGVIYESPDKYRGRLSDLDSDAVTLVLRPNLNW